MLDVFVTRNNVHCFSHCLNSVILVCGQGLFLIAVCLRFVLSLPMFNRLVLLSAIVLTKTIIISVHTAAY